MENTPLCRLISDLGLQKKPSFIRPTSGSGPPVTLAQEKCEEGGNGERKEDPAADTKIFHYLLFLATLLVY